MKHDSSTYNESYHFIDGGGKIFVSAPHNAEHFRDGAHKHAEPETGPVALFLNKELNCPCIIKVTNDGSDPNYDSISDYRDFLIKQIKSKRGKLLLDFHQMSPERLEMVCIGTGFGKNIQNRFELIDVLKKCFTDNEINNISVDNPFPAVFDYTVSRTVSEMCEIPAIQIEINTQLFLTQPLKQKVYDSLYCIIKVLEDAI